MSQIAKFSPGTTECMQKLLKLTKKISEYKRVQCVLLGSLRVPSHKMSSVTNYAPRYVRHIWQEYRAKGVLALLGERRGQVRGRAYLTLAEEKAFLQPFFNKAKEGGMLVVSSIHQAYGLCKIDCVNGLN